MMAAANRIMFGLLLTLLAVTKAGASATEAQKCAWVDDTDADLPCASTDMGKWLQLSVTDVGRGLTTADLVINTGGNPQAQAKLLWTEGFVPQGRDLDPWPFELPLDWDADPFEDRNWRFNLHAWRMIGPLLAVYEANGESQYLLESIEIMLDWHRYHYRPPARESRYQWYDMAAGLRAMKLAYVIGKVARDELALPDQQLGVLVELARRHVTFLMDVEMLADNNHGLFQVHGLNVLCQTLPILADCRSYEAFVNEELTALVHGQFSAEGIHLEHSPAYHFLGFNVLRRMFETGWYDDMSELVDRIERAGRNRKWMVHPDKTMVTVGDSRPQRMDIDFPAGAPTCRDVEAMHSDCMRLAVFPKSGYAMVRSDWSVPSHQASMLFFMAAFHGGTHKLPDDLSFEWFEQGARVLTNAGVYAYQTDQWRSYVSSTRAHNTVEVDQRNFTTAGFAAYGSALVDARNLDGVFRIYGEARHGNLNLRHKRTVLYVPGQWLGVRDRLVTDMPERATQWFHFAPDFEVVEEEDRLRARRDDGFELLVGSNAASLSVHRGDTEPRIQGWVTQRYGEMVPRASAGFHHSGFELEMLAWFAVSEDAWEAVVDALDGLEDLP